MGELATLSSSDKTSISFSMQDLWTDLNWQEFGEVLGWMSELPWAECGGIRSSKTPPVQTSWGLTRVFPSSVYEVTMGVLLFTVPDEGHDCLCYWWPTCKTNVLDFPLCQNFHSRNWDLCLFKEQYLSACGFHHRIFWLGRDPEGSLGPPTKWIARKGIKPVTMALCSNQLR